MNKLDNFCIFIASRYFETVKDYENLEKTTKEYGNITNDFHYNPISLTKKEFELFPNIQTFHIYNEKDLSFVNKFKNYVDWITEKSYSDYLKTYNKDTPVIYKNITLTKEDVNTVLKDNIIKIPPVITSIDRECFEEVTNLECVEIPNSVTYIGTKAFSDCLNLKDVELPEFLEDINRSCFEGCGRLENVKMPKFLKSIDDGVFFNCHSLTNLDLPNSIINIGEYSLISCGFDKITLPTSLKYIGVDVLQLLKVKVPKSALSAKIFDSCSDIDWKTINEYVCQYNLEVLEN